MSLITGRAQCGIYCRSDCGPVSGGGHDLYISNSSSSSSKFIKSPASGSSDLIYNNWKSNKNDL